MQGWLQIHRSGQWYPLGFNIKKEEKAKYNTFFEALAEEVCVSTITKGSQTPRVVLEHAKNSDFPSNVAHIDVKLYRPNDGNEKFFKMAGRFHFNIAPTFDTTQFLKIGKYGVWKLVMLVIFTGKSISLKQK